MTSDKEIISNHSFKNRKNIIIFSIISIFSIQSLIFITQFQINFPYSMDHLGIDHVYHYVESNVFPYDELFASHSGHYFFFPRLIAIPNLLLNSFDLVNLYYLHWFLMSISLFFIFLLLKNTEQKIYWILIPISAFIYSPLQPSTYWPWAMLPWFLAPIGFYIIIFQLTKKSTNAKTLSISISFTILSTFSAIMGIIAWLPGLIILIKKNYTEKWQNKKWLLIWVCAIIIIGSIYYVSIPKADIQTNPLSLFSLTGYSFIATFASAAFRLKYDFLMVLVGTSSILLSIFYFYYFIYLKNNVKYAFPWILLILSGILCGILTALGRVHLEGHLGNEPYYIPFSHFIQIGLLILTALMIIQIKNRKNQRKKILLAIFYSIIILHMVLLIPSYYAGWWRGDYYFQEKSQYVNCFSLNHGDECIQNNILRTDVNYEIINYWIENKMIIFNEKLFNQNNFNDIQNFKKIWDDNKNLNIGIGKIETINNVSVENPFSITNKNSIILSGWMLDKNYNQLDSVYLLVDGKPFLKHDDFNLRTDISIIDYASNVKPGWTIAFLSGYLEEGCHKIAIVGIKDSEIFSLEQEFDLCKTHV